MSNAAHTPTPWKLNTFEGLLVYGCKGGRTAKACGIDDAQAVANAAFIVRAVNSHASLVALNEELVGALEFYAHPENWKQHETGIGMMPSDADLDGGSRAIAALARAKA